MRSTLTLQFPWRSIAKVEKDAEAILSSQPYSLVYNKWASFK